MNWRELGKAFLLILCFLACAILWAITTPFEPSSVIGFLSSIVFGAVTMALLLCVTYRYGLWGEPR